MPSLTIIDSEYTGTNKFKEYPFELSNFQKNAIDSYLKVIMFCSLAQPVLEKLYQLNLLLIMQLKMEKKLFIQHRLRRYLIKNLNLLKNFPMQMRGIWVILNSI